MTSVVSDASPLTVAPTHRPAATIAGTGSYVPRRRVTNADIEAVMDTSDEWIVERTGIRERRFAAEGEATASMATEAARVALRDAHVDTANVGLLVLATCTPDYVMPPASALVSEALGLRCGALDLNAACAGFVYGLVTASAMVAAGAGTVLLIGADTMSRILDPADRSTGMLFGDGAGAVVVAPAGGPPTWTGGRATGAPSEGPGLVAWDLGCDGSAADILNIPAGGSRMPATLETVAANQHVVKMEGREVYRRAVRAVVDSVSATLDKAGVGPEDIGLFIPHQANARIVDGVLPRLGIPAERTLVNIDRYGNTSAGSIPIALDEAVADGRLHDGDLVLMTGFGAGMTWASALSRWGRPAEPPSRDARVDLAANPS